MLLLLTQSAPSSAPNFNWFESWAEGLTSKCNTRGGQDEGGDDRVPRRPPHCHVLRRPRLPSARCCRLRSSIARQREVENLAHMDAWATGRARCARVSRAYCARSRESRSHSETKGRYLRVPRRPPHCHVLRRPRLPPSRCVNLPY